MTTVTVRNGVNVTQLMETIDAVKANPDIAKFTFRSQTTWEAGGRSSSRIQGFHGALQEDQSRAKPFILTGDEPPVLLGGNAGPNAVEAVLHAIGACVAVGFIYNAAALGIEVRSLEFETEGDLDLQGFLGLSEDVRPGYSAISVRYKVDADAPREKIEELCRYVQKTSPVLDIVRNPVAVNVELAG
jgi:uncharacterized OsmC-like protein